jgi:hypothetical protein
MSNSKTITITGTEKEIRRMITRAIRVWGAMNRYEEQTIEDAFLDLADKRAERQARTARADMVDVT